MKKSVVSVLMGALTTILLTGCAWEVGGGAKNVTYQPTVGQQLIDLQKAKDTGAITDSEYQVQKTKVLDKK